MMPAEPFPSKVHEPADSGAVDTSSQRKRPRPDRRAARERPEFADKPRPEDKSALVIWAYVEYQRLRLEGQSPDVSQWCAQFPTCRSALRQVLEIEAYTGSFLDRRRPSSGDEAINWPSEGEQRAGFTIIRELARGAFARVYLATEASTGDRFVVLKCSPHGDAEARTMGRLIHPHIVPIHSARFDDESRLTIVCMPYLGCATLEDVLDHILPDQERPSKASFLRDVINFRAQPEDSLRSADPGLFHGSYTDCVIHLAAQLTEALAFLHQNGVCHRDLKPSNVLLDPSGKPLLLDFNLSESEREAAVPLGGTLRYMAPEQVRAFLDGGKDGIDQRVDFYALGVMVYELLGGVHPCATLLAESFAPSQAQSLLGELKVGFRPFRAICPELGRPVAAVLDRCVALDASNRPNNAAELAAALKLQFTPARKLRRRLASHRRSLLATLGLVVLSVTVLTYVWAVTPPYSQREYERGRIAYDAGDFNAAEQHFNRALRAEPRNDRFRHARGCARLQQSKYLPPDLDRFDQIREDLSFTKQGATDACTLSVFAFTDLLSQRTDAALRRYNTVLQTGYRPMMAYNNRAYCYMRKAQLEEAQLDLEKAVQLGPDYQAVRYNLAMLAFSKRLRKKIDKIPPEAMDDMDKALQLGAITSALCRDAAHVYAQADTDYPSHAYLDRALPYLRQAIMAGHAPDQFMPRPALKRVLESPEFVALRASSPSEPLFEVNLRIIDPLDLPD